MTSRPSWRVLGVFDPEGEQPEFSYTLGLCDLGLPELHVWARPDRGEDPGADWALSTRDRMHLLNQFGQSLREGTLDLGKSIVETVDGGAATLTFTFGAPTDPAALDAFQVAAGAQVIPVHWSLGRAPVGELAPMTPAAQDRAAERFAQLTATPTRGLPSRFDVGPADFSHQLELGPAQPLVRARAAQLLSAHEDDLAAFVELALGADRGADSKAVLALSAAAGRASGRIAALDATREYAAAVVEELTGGPERPNTRWEAVLGQLDDEPMDPLDRLSFVQAAHQCAAYAVAALLSTEAVSDVATDELLAAGFGPWEYAVAGDPLEAPGPLWHAPRPVLDAVRTDIASWGTEQVEALAAAHGSYLDSGEGSRALYWWCRAQATTSRAAVPPMDEYLAGTGCLLVLHDMTAAGSAGRGLAEGFVDALAMLVPALSHAEHLHPGAAQELTATYGRHLPSVASLLQRAS